MWLHILSESTLSVGSLLRFLISFKTVWFGALVRRSFPGPPAVFAAIYNEIVALCAPLAIVLLN